MEAGAHVDREPEQLNIKTDCSHFLHQSVLVRVGFSYCRSKSYCLCPETRVSCMFTLPKGFTVCRQTGAPRMNI